MMSSIWMEPLLDMVAPKSTLPSHIFCIFVSTSAFKPFVFFKEKRYESVLILNNLLQQYTVNEKLIRLDTGSL